MVWQGRVGDHSPYADLKTPFDKLRADSLDSRQDAVRYPTQAKTGLEWAPIRFRIGLELFILQTLRFARSLVRSLGLFNQDHGTVNRGTPLQR